jgi:hypothetical protein
LVGDPFVTDPFRCRFDPGVLACKGASSDGCLTLAEVATARAFYAGPSSGNGKPLFFGWLPGSEGTGIFGWSFLENSSNGQPQFASLFKWVFGGGWDWRGFDVDRDMPIVDTALGRDVNDATRGSLSAFAARGGRLILYHGLADTLVPPGQTVAFYEHQARRLGGMARLRGATRLFLAPGVMHCGGGAGPDSFNSASAGVPPPPAPDAQDDLFLALVAWVEENRPPERVIATKFEVTDRRKIAFQRPLCAYPRQAVYTGKGPTDVAESFACGERPRPSR